MSMPSHTPLTAAALDAQLGETYARYSEAERALHLNLLDRVTSPGDLAFDACDLSDSRWRLTLCAGDAVGTLSVIAGLLTAARLDIEAADIFTVRIALPTVRRTGDARVRPRPGATVEVRRALDIFDVRALAPLGSEGWKRLRADLGVLLRLLATGNGEEARTTVIDRLVPVLSVIVPEERRLWPVSVTTSTDRNATALHIHGQDTPGFLFELTNALTLLDVNITAAEIRSVAGESRDVLWISDRQGHPVTDSARLAQIRAAVALIKEFTVLLPHAPDPAQAMHQFGALTRQLLAQPDWAAALPHLASNDVQRTLADLMGASAFLWEDFLRMQHANLFPVVDDAAGLDTASTPGVMRERLHEALGAADSIEAQTQALNAFKDREMFRIDLRHITGRIGFAAFADELSALAEVVVDAAARLAIQAIQPQFGPPPCAWTVAALGKCGGREMGFASDVELLFTYAGDGSIEEHARYFEALVRAFLDILVARREGIFEVDLRLRPYGNAGPLASSEAGLAVYYAPNGSAMQFERLALVKLRTVAGDVALGKRVEAIRDAFVYSGAPLDYAGIRYLRDRQATELVQAGAVNSKYSLGGLVDIEYWVQARQIEAGAQDTAVRVPSTLLAIEQLAAGGHIAPEDTAHITATYAFLRRLIDALRIVRGHARDLTVPQHDSREFGYLARRLDLDASELAQAIESHMAVARGLWNTPQTS